MTVASTLARKTFAGDAVTTSFGTSPMVFFATSDLQVRITVNATGVSTLLTENTDYTVSGGGTQIPAVGTVSLAGGSSPHGAVAAGSTLVITRVVALTQQTDFVQDDSSDADVAEATIDKLTMIAQQQQGTLDRSFTLSTGDVSGASTTIPTPSASSLVGWNGAGTALQNYTTSALALAVTTAYTLTLLDDPDASTALATLTTEKFALSGDITPTQISANQNDYNPTGLSTASVLRISTDASRNITSIAGGADGRLLLIHNVGSNDAVLKKDDGATGTAANRFQVSRDVTLRANESVLIQYDSTTTRWRLVSYPSKAPTIQVFTATGASTYTTPNGLKRAKVTVVGAGAGGGGAAAAANSACGGAGAGATAIKWLDATTIGASQTVTVGAKGAGGAAGQNNGVAGGTSSFGAIVSCTGGQASAGANGAGSNPGVGGTASSGDININGGTGGIPINSLPAGGQGATSTHGGGGAAGFSSGGNAASGFGAGGGGATNAGGSAAAGGNGSDGIVIVEEFY